MNKKLQLLLFFYMVTVPAHPQNVLTLEAYIDSVLQRNPAIQYSANVTDEAGINQRQSIWNFTPSVDAQLNINKIYGTAFDNVTFQRIQRATTNIFPSLNLNVTLFDGLIGVLRVRNARFTKNTAVLQEGITKTIQVTEAIRLYCQYITDRQSTQVYKGRRDALEKLVRQKKTAAETGAISHAALLAVTAQFELEKANLLEATVREETSLRNLYAFIMYGPDTSHRIPGDFPDETVVRNKIMGTGLVYETLRAKKRETEQLKTTNLRWQALSAFSPKLYFSASLASSYSSNGIVDYATGNISYPDYTTQFRLNGYQFAGLTLSVPLFNRMQRISNLQKTKIACRDTELRNAEETLADENARILLERNRHSLAQKQILLETSAEASETAYREQEMKFSEGHTDFYTYMNALNTRDAARLEVLKNQAERLVNTVERAFRGMD